MALSDERSANQQRYQGRFTRASAGGSLPAARATFTPSRQWLPPVLRVLMLPCLANTVNARSARERAGRRALPREMGQRGAMKRHALLVAAAVWLAVSPGEGRTETMRQEPTAVQTRLPNDTLPVLGCWFWHDDEFAPEGYRPFLDQVGRHAAYNLLTTSIRAPEQEVTDPRVHDQIRRAAAYARRFGIGLVMDLDVRLARAAYRQAYGRDAGDAAAARWRCRRSDRPSCGSSVMRGSTTPSGRRLHTADGTGGARLYHERGPGASCRAACACCRPPPTA